MTRKAAGAWHLRGERIPGRPGRFVAAALRFLAGVPAAEVDR